MSLITVGVWLLVGCRPEKGTAELESLKARLEVEEQNKQVMLKFFEAWNAADFQTLEALSSSDYAFYHPSNSTEAVSREGLFSLRRSLQEGFPDMSWRLEDLVADDETVVLRFIHEGTHEGEWEAIPATGKKIRCSGILLSRIRDGKVIEQREEFDSMTMMRQLGMELELKGE